MKDLWGNSLNLTPTLVYLNVQIVGWDNQEIYIS